MTPFKIKMFAMWFILCFCTFAIMFSIKKLGGLREFLRILGEENEPVEIHG